MRKTSLIEKKPACLCCMEKPNRLQVLGPVHTYPDILKTKICSPFQPSVRKRRFRAQKRQVFKNGPQSEVFFENAGLEGSSGRTKTQAIVFPSFYRFGMDGRKQFKQPTCKRVRFFRTISVQTIRRRVVATQEYCIADRFVIKPELPPAPALQLFSNLAVANFQIQCVASALLQGLTTQCMLTQA